MTRIPATFQALRRSGCKVLVCYLTVGYPTIEATVPAVQSLVAAGCDIVELGIPFSDPLADGTTIQRASFQALQNSVTPQVCLDVASNLRKSVDVPLVFMTYYNPILSYGLSAFCAGCAEAGVDGLIVPDLPPEEGEELGKAARSKSLDVIYLLAPTSTEERVRLVAEKSTGFIYLVSLTGVTGARKVLPPELEDFVSEVKRHAKQPLCVGFGISSPEQAARAARVADGVIVGSKLVDFMEHGDLSGLDAFVRSLRQELPCDDH